VDYLTAVTSKENIPLVLDPAPAQPLPSSLLKVWNGLRRMNRRPVPYWLESQDVPADAMKEIAEILLQRGSRNVLLKLGKRGCYLALADAGGYLCPRTRFAPLTRPQPAMPQRCLCFSVARSHDPVRCATWLPLSPPFPSLAKALNHPCRLRRKSAHS